MVWAFGNEATCNVSGILGVFFITTWLYHAAISVYYVLLVRFGLRDENIRWQYEVMMHLVAILWPTSGAAAALALNGFGPTLTSYGCFVSDWPDGCVRSTTADPLEEGEVECDDSVVHWTVLPASYTSFATILFCNLVIFCHVRSTILTHAKNSLRRFGKSDPSPSLSWNRSSKMTTSATILSHGQTEHIRAVRNQSLLYLCATFATVVPVSVQKYVSTNNPSLSRESESSIYGLIISRAIFPSISGFFNLIIFCRPTYLRYRRNSPDESRISAFRRTIEAGTGRAATSKGIRRRQAPQQKYWWNGILKLRRREDNKPVVASPPVATPPDQRGHLKTAVNQEDTMHAIPEGQQVDAEDLDLTSATPGEANDFGGGEDVDESLPSRLLKANSDVDYSCAKNKFSSSASIELIMVDGSSSNDESNVDDDDTELADGGIDDLSALPNNSSYSSGEKKEKATRFAASAEGGPSSSISNSNNYQPTIEFDSSCIGSISTASTVDA
eukprot:CAMPEP_0117077512 /NCGR_PEP_ID=MMETSP0472-20121206/54659_1 /TAXON_ID=693140 ORGANISM="Tiarina fusus, Strain LIS" /NCGR_SAMPLE_ID=MMETSP0472 /ASSEMBLY_ACC=CAM_ASM_000603 /LENGTH=499 /DNA_ID=CAMNT_0004803889 /DNA_START=348 /DNA_END=1847 /DNA_ORIENTATION=-